MSLDKILLGRFGALESDMPTAGGVSDSLQVGEVVDEDGHQVDTSDTAEENLMLADAEASEVEEASDEITELSETTDALESFLTQAQIARRNGGWTTQEAVAYGLGIDVALKRVGASSKDVIASMESFGTSRERISSTAAVENRLTDAIKKIWEAIKRAVNKVIVFVRKWYLKIFDGTTKLKKRAQALRKKADNTTGTIKEKKIRTGVLASLCKGDKNMPTGQEIATGIEKLAKVIGSVTEGSLESSFKDNLDKLVTTVEKMAETKSVDRIGTALGEMHEVIGTIVKFDTVWKDGETISSDTKVPQLSGTGVLLRTAEIGTDFGNREIWTIDPSGIKKGDQEGDKGTTDHIDNLAKVAGSVFTIRVENKENRKFEVDESKEVPTLSSSDVSSICSAVESLCDVVIDYKKGFENYEAASKKIISKMDKLTSKKWDDVDANDKEDSGIQAKTVRKFATAIGNMMRNRGNGITTIISHGMTISRNALSYGSQSLSQYKDN